MENTLPHTTLSANDLNQIACHTADIILSRLGLATLGSMAQTTAPTSPPLNDTVIPHHIANWITPQKAAEQLGVSIPYIKKITDNHPELVKRCRTAPQHKRTRLFFDITGIQLIIHNINP